MLVNTAYVGCCKKELYSTGNQLYHRKMQRNLGGADDTKICTDVHI